MTPSPEESTLKELGLYAKAWIKYISVATLQGENALTRKGVEDAIKGYSNVTEDFTNSLKSLIQERERLARINELERIMSGQKTVREYVGDVDDIITYVFSADEINERLKDLSKQAVKVKAVTK